MVQGAKKRIFNMFPGRTPDRWWLYVLGTDDTVKVGKTTNPRGRLNLHRLRLRGGMRWCHLLGSGDRIFGFNAENAAISALALVYERIGRSEEFRGGEICKSEVIGICRGAIQSAYLSKAQRAAYAAAHDASAEAWQAAYESAMGSLLIDDEI
jgi:hypothetical protein